MVNSKKTINNFQLLIPIETYRNCDIPGGQDQPPSARIVLRYCQFSNDLFKTLVNHQDA